MNTQSSTQEKQVTPSQIMQVGMGFWASKTLLTAVKLEIFTHLSLCPLSGEEIQAKTGLHSRALYDFLDALVALGFLQREGQKEDAFYSNTEETDLFLDKLKPTYIGGMLEMANHRLYRFWDNLEEALKTGEPQNEIKEMGTSLFEGLYADPDRLKEFLKAMQGVQMGAFVSLANQFDFSNYSSLCDVGGASGALAIQVALNNPHMKCITADLPPVQPIASENIRNFHLENRVTADILDFFEHAQFPKTDVITMGNVLHDWGVHDKKMLIQKAYEALPKGGSLIVIENVIDDERRGNVFGLLMSLNMLIETEEGFDFSHSDFKAWASEVGFSTIELMPLAGPTSAIIALK